jgi:hypothetical protein
MSKIKVVTKDMECCAEVNGRGWYGADGWCRAKCHRAGSVERDGKLYCRTHDPVAVEKRETEAKAKREERWKGLEDKWLRNKAVHEALDGISIETINREVRALVLHLVGK